MRTRTKILAGITGAAGMLTLIGAIASAGQHPSAGPAASPAVSAVQYTTVPPAAGTQPATPAPGTPKAAPAASTPAPAPSTPAPSSPAMTVSEQQAVESAQSYLNLDAGFSRLGLLQQLTSKYGAGFSAADAAFAVNYLHPDWNAQAVESAEGYVKNVGGFSRDSLLQQLTSSYGAQFTPAQAQYAVSKVMG